MSARPDNEHDARPAVAAAEAGARAWRAVFVAQRAAAPDHGAFYDVASELVDTLVSLQAVAGLLGRQVAGYGRGRVLRDDEGADPTARLGEALGYLDEAGEFLSRAQYAANRYWSAISHIAIEEP